MAKAKAGARDDRARMVRTVGIALIVGGVLVDSIGLVYEPMVWIGGAFVTVAGLLGIVVVLVKDFAPSANLLGLFGVLLGVALAIHDFVLPPGIAVAGHITIGALMVLVGLLHVMGRANLLRLLGEKRAA